MARAENITAIRLASLALYRNLEALRFAHSLGQKVALDVAAIHVPVILRRWRPQGRQHLFAMHSVCRAIGPTDGYGVRRWLGSSVRRDH